MFLENIKTTDFDPNRKYTFVIPMGATEQHGPFLPTGTDSFLMDCIIRDCEGFFPNIVFLPTLRVTCSEEHEGFPGSVWISTDTMKRILVDICHSLRPYAKTIAFASFHGGNLKFLDSFVLEREMNYEGVKLLHIPVGSEEAEKKMCELLDGPTDAHAGNVEISMMLSEKESLVDVPSPSYKKSIIKDAFGTNHIKDFSDDGIADNHPAWIVSKENGKMFTEWIVEDFKNELGKL
jgi:creatinine amidohydrolase/Fe(II)-dependent formamide hydrolase-like protein